MRLGLTAFVCGWMVGATAGAAPPTSAPATTSASNLAELPAWPIGLRLPDELVGKRPKKDEAKADVLVWIPPGARHIRAFMLVPNNTDSKNFLEHAKLREVLARHETAIVYLRQYATGFEHTKTDPPPAPENILKLLPILADETGIQEFRHAPWITFGKSSRGEFPFRMAWLYPQRTIAAMSYHGETPTWPIPPWAKLKDETILQVNVNGQTEWEGTWYRHVRPCLLNYRARTSWLPHQVVVYGVGHGNYVDANGSKGWGQPVPPGTVSCLRVWDYMSVFVDKALALRVSRDQYPTTGPVALKQVDPDSGYLVHPRAVEERLKTRWRPLRNVDGVYVIVDHIKEPGEVYDPNPGTLDPALLIRKASDVPAAERRSLFWLADQEQVDAWLALMTPPVGATAPAQ